MVTGVQTCALPSMQEVSAQMRRDQVELQASLERQKLEFSQRAASAEESLRVLERDARAVSDKIDNRKRELAQLDMHLSDTVVMVDNGLTNYVHPAESSLELSGRLSEVRSQIKEMIRDKVAIRAREGFTFNNSASQGRKFVADMSKMMLRAYNAEVENCVLTVKAGNGEAARKRLERTRDHRRCQGAPRSSRHRPRPPPRGARRCCSQGDPRAGGRSRCCAAHS